MLLAVSAHQEGRHVHQLLANANVALLDKDSGVVDGLGQIELEDLGLKSSLHEDLSCELEDVIKGVLLVGKDTVSLQSADQRRGLEKTLGVLGVKHEKSSGSLRQFSKQTI